MSNLLLIAVCIFSGIILRRTPYFNEESSSTLNQLIIYFFIPLITLYQIPKIEFSTTLIWLSLCPFIVFFGSILFFNLLSLITNIKRETKAALILTSGISSTSFIGFPIFELLYGQEGLAYGVIMSLGGTILVFNTIGTSTLFYYTESKFDFFEIIKKIFTFIPFIAFLIGLGINFLGISYPLILDSLLSSITKPFAIIALLSIGLQIDFKINKEMFKNILFGQFYKLILAPLIIYLIVWNILGIQDLIGRICILGAAIGSMNAMSILTAEKKLNPNLATLMPAIGIPISIPILFIIDKILK